MQMFRKRGPAQVFDVSTKLYGPWVLREARNTAGEGARAPHDDLENYVVVGRSAAFQAFRPPAIEWTFL